MRVKLLHVHEFRDRHGTVRRYFRRPGHKRATLPGAPGSPEFMLAYQAALGEARKPIGVERNKPGTAASWISLYLASAEFARLAVETRRTRKNLLERFRAEHGLHQAGALTAAHLAAIIGNLSPVVGRNFLKALRPWLKWCVKQDLRSDNPAMAVERPAHRTDGYLPWTESQIIAYRKKHPIGTKARVALELLVTTGAARVDAVRLGRQHVRDGVISFRRHKTNVLVEIPILESLIAALDAMPASDHLGFMTTDYGKPFSDAGFGNWFRKRCNEAGIPTGYSAHGVRKYAATEHANRGATAHELMAWFGWLSIREAERYTRTAARRKLALGMVQRLNT